MSLKDIFSEVTRKHSPRDTAKVFIAGTDLTTPDEIDMLSGWQKPFLFARFFVVCAVFTALCYALQLIFGDPRAYFLLMILLCSIVPLTLLILMWEMNIPRNISLYEVLKIVAIGGVLSLIATFALGKIDPTTGAIWAALTEEPAKLLIVYLVLRRKNYKFTLNGILIGVAVGTGFAVLENLFYSFYNGFTATLLSGETLGTALMKGTYLSVIRAVTDIPGHGLYAGLYGGALVRAKGAEPVKPAHLTKPEFLKYFAVSFLVHMLNNAGLFSSITVHAVVLSVVMVAAFLPMLRMGVNEIVEYTARLNGGRVTIAVNRAGAAFSGEKAVGGVRLECVAGPSVGQVYTCPEGGTLTLGRTAGKCDIALPGSASVSGLHCAISVSGGRVTVTDRNSTNGTYLGSQRLLPNQPTPAADGAVIFLGSKNCGFRIGIR